MSASTITYCKIFPPIGIARVGESRDPEGFFYGPELDTTRGPDFTYRDAAGQIKRQAARFRIIAFDGDDVPVQELSADDADIEWTVSLANKKAAWFEFNGTERALAAHRGLLDTLQVPRNASVGTMVREKIPGGHRWKPSRERAKLLEIDGGTRVIAGVSQRSSSTDPSDNYIFAGKFRNSMCVELGELRTDDVGRLIVLGGFGVSEAIDATGASIRERRWIRNYANNDDWHDDMSDGPVTARVTLKGALEELEVRGGAWVIVAPPDFAPDVANVVTLFDVMEEVVTLNPDLLRPDTIRPRTPDDLFFATDIEPILNRVEGYRWVSEKGLRGHGSQKPGDFHLPGRSAALRPELMEANSPSGQLVREKIFSMIRTPAYERGIEYPARYTDPAVISQATTVYMPPLAGDEGDPVGGQPETWLTLTYLQYDRLAAWCKGCFRPGGDPIVDTPPATKQEEMLALIHRLTKVPLDACTGGAFYPGIEMTCIAREPSIYSEAFRLDHETLAAGDITKYMAVPWQADFWECRDHWWPAQRPDDVVPEREFDLLLQEFTDEVSGDFKQPFEQVLFNRIRWDRGVGSWSRPSLSYTQSRVLPEPSTDSLEEFIAKVTQVDGDDRGYDPVARLFIQLTPVLDFVSLATDAWQAGENGDALPSPWRLQFLSQSALDEYAGLYFHLKVPSPDEALRTVLGDDPSAYTGLESPDSVRSEWHRLRVTTPAVAARLLGHYAVSVSKTLSQQIEVVFREHPTSGSGARALWKAFNELPSVAQMEDDHPEDFGADSQVFKIFRAADMMEQLGSLGYATAITWSGDMDMVNQWRRMGFVVRRTRHAKRSDGTQVLVEAQVETERPRYDGRSYRDYFYYLMNLEEFPDFAIYAKTIAEQVLASAQKIIDETGIFDTTHPESFVPYSRESFGAKLEEIYEILRGQAVTALGWQTNRTREDWFRLILDRAPFNQTDGAWLRYIANAGPTDQVRAFLFEVWSDEVGNGDPTLHHGNLYSVLLRSLGFNLPDISTRAYADNSEIGEGEFVGAVFQLAISLHSESYFPELLGMTLFLEWEVLSLVPGIKGREYMGIDPQFWEMHVGIDNASNGHGAKARAAIELYLDRVFKESGKAAMDAEWARIWRGFVAFATAGFDFEANTDGQDDETIKRAHPGSPRNRVIDLMHRKAHYGSLNHRDRRLGGHRINDLFDEPEMFVSELERSPWVIPGNSDESRLLSYLTTFAGPMYKVFNQHDLALWREWIEWLGREGDTASPKRYISKADGMLILVSELRELAMGSSGHRRYRLEEARSVADTADAATSMYEPTARNRTLVGELFEHGDLRDLLRALRNPFNGWVVPYDPGSSPIVLDLARPDRPMGRALDRRFVSLNNQIGRRVLIRWIIAGCGVPGEDMAASSDVPRQPKWDGRRLFVQQLGMGAVH